MLLRYPGEVELERRGIDEGAGRGFDNIDLSAAATRVIAAADSAPEIVDWFVRELTGLGWTHSGGGWLVRDQDESLLVRVDRDCGKSTVARMIAEPRGREIQLSAERAWYAGAPPDWSVLTLSYLIAYAR